jgi:hypothetical protein
VFGTEPGSGDAAGGELGLEGRVCADEAGGYAPLFLHEGSLAELRVAPRLFKASDALDAVHCVGIEDVVIADPEFEGEVRPEWNEMVEGRVVANGPWEAAKDRNG